MNRTTLIILAVICAIIFIAPLAIYNGHGEDDGYFGGADDAAGEAIEESGFKGKSIGGAAVSEKHANFIINIGNAKGEEIKELINEIKNKIKEKYNIELKVEQEFVE